jgi:hypothetical protein
VHLYADDEPRADEIEWGSDTFLLIAPAAAPTGLYVELTPELRANLTAIVERWRQEEQGAAVDRTVPVIYPSDRKEMRS